MNAPLIVDNFAGGGGASTGLEMAYGRPVDIAINHDTKAIEMHTANHPRTLHITENVFRVSPKTLCAGKPVECVWFSPDCTHFSKAKGSAPNRPKDRKIRGLAWVAVRWAVQVKPRLIFLENVEEFKTWGPLKKDGTPDKARSGAYFHKFISRLTDLGYAVEYRTMIASDYGAPTSRKRFFLIARADGEKIHWPKPTHGKGLQPYRTAAECIDWSIPTHSIFLSKEDGKRLGCKRPLAESTLKRIARGIQKFVLENPDPFVLNDQQTAAFMGYHYTGHDGYDLHKPLKTITAIDHHTLVTAFLSKYHGLQGIESRCYAVNQPLCTLDTSNRFALVTAFLIKYYGNGTGQNLKEPMATVMGVGKFGIVLVRGQEYRITDIGLRMLTPKELAKAQGFPEGYILSGTKANQVQKIGNSVPPQLANAIAKVNIQNNNFVTLRAR